MGKILRISFKLNFTPNTLGSYGLRIKPDEQLTYSRYRCDRAYFSAAAK